MIGLDKSLRPLYVWELGTVKGRKRSHMARQRIGCCITAAPTIGGPEAVGDTFVILRNMRSPCEGSI